MGDKMKILGSDYDGTLKVDGEVSLENIEMIKKWRAQGNLFGIVTGRSTTTIRQEIKTKGLDIDFLVCNNGGVILDKNLEIEQILLLDFDAVEKIVEHIETIESNGYVLNDGVNRSRVAKMKIEDDLHNAPSTISMEEILANKKVAQIVVNFNKQEAANALAAYINENFGNKAEAFTNLNCVDIVPKGASKENGLRHIAKRENVSEDNVYSIGDSYNDICMIEAFHGATLNHAIDAIKEHSEVSVKDVAEYLSLLMSL